MRGLSCLPQSREDRVEGNWRSMAMAMAKGASSLRAAGAAAAAAGAAILFVLAVPPGTLGQDDLKGIKCNSGHTYSFETKPNATITHHADEPCKYCFKIKDPSEEGQTNFGCKSSDPKFNKPGEKCSCDENLCNDADFCKPPPATTTSKDKDGGGGGGGGGSVQPGPLAAIAALAAAALAAEEAA